MSNVAALAREGKAYLGWQRGLHRIVMTLPDVYKERVDIIEKKFDSFFFFQVWDRVRTEAEDERKEEEERKRKEKERKEERKERRGETKGAK